VARSEEQLNDDKYDCNNTNKKKSISGNKKKSARGKQKRLNDDKVGRNNKKKKTTITTRSIMVGIPRGKNKVPRGGE